MPRLIFKCPYIKGGTSSATAHLENYVKYMATRNGVERIDPGRSEWPATSKQKKMVEQILRDFPLSRGMFEYEDYAAEPTRANASEFITRALEDNYDQIAKKDNYLKYIATRPRAQRVGSHGLFTGEEDQLVLAQVAEAVAAHPGNVWLPIISLRREDAARLGYDKAEEWKALLSKYAMEMAEAMKIPWEDFRWYAAFHDEAHHPHIHMVCYSADPSKGFLTTQGIAQIKSGLAKEIFRQELTELYQKQTQSRNTLNEDARSVLEQLIEQMWSGAVVNHRMEKLMEHLAERLRHTGGRKQYGYLKAPLKAVVDEIVDELTKEPCVAAAYVALCGTAGHAMLWMLEKNPNLRKAILCLDHDAAGIEAVGRLSEVLREHGYSQIAPLQSEYKDWDEDLKARHGLEAQPAEEHPQFAVAGLVCRRIGARCKEVQPDRAVYQFPGLLLRYRNDLHWGRFDQAMERMETMAALALSVVLRECKQMGTALTTEQGVRFLESHILPHQNRGILKNRADEIAMQFQSVLAKNNCRGIRTQAEKKEVASAWLELAISCAKVPVKYEADEIKRRQKEEKTQREAEPVMA